MITRFNVPLDSLLDYLHKEGINFVPAVPQGATALQILAILKAQIIDEIIKRRARSSPQLEEVAGGTTSGVPTYSREVESSGEENEEEERGEEEETTNL